jgi:microcystin-dependent protein
MANPVFVDGVAAAKSSARAFIAYVLDTRDTLRTTDMGGSWLVYVREADRWFERDTSDTTSPDDGTSVIVDPTGNRWKSAQVALGGIRIDAAGNTATRDAYDDAPPPFVYYDVEAERAYVKQSNDTADWSPGFPIRGPKGDGLQIDAVGDLVDRDLYDDEPKGFTFLATDTAALYVKLSNATADWSPPIAFGGGGGGTTNMDDMEDGTTKVAMRVTERELLQDIANYQALRAAMIGTVIDTARSTAPDGWLLCYGQAVSRTTYSALFEAIGTIYGVGDGATTFNLPDLRGRVVAGKDNMGGTAANRLTNQPGGINGAGLGAVGGSETHTLTIAQMPAHTHTYARSGYTSLVQGGENTGTNSTSTQNTGSSGSDQAHNNVQPTIILNKIIFTGVFS